MIYVPDSLPHFWFQFYRDFDIDPSLTHVWRYLMNAYETEVFQKSVPCDQDIIKHYEMKVRLH